MTDAYHNSTQSRSAGQSGAVLLFGEVLADIFPDRTVLGGAPFNVARHLKAFGQNPVLVTRLGHDSLRDEVLDAMSQAGMETLGVQCANNHPTGQVLVHIENVHHRFEILPAQAYDFIHPGMVRMATLSVNPVLVYFGTLAQRGEISKRALKAMLRSTGAPKFLDVNLRAPWYDEATLILSLQSADTVKLNIEELGMLAKMFDLQGNNPQDHAMELMHRFGVQQAVVTLGDEGAWQVNHNGTKVQLGTENKIKNPVDTVGAGDGFAAVYILGTLLRWPADKILKRANAFAAAICEFRGAIPDHADFYEPYVREWGV